LVKSARGAFLPQFELRAGMWWAGPEFDRMTTNYGAELSLIYPERLGMNLWQVNGQLAEAQAQARASEADARVEHNRVSLEGEQARTELIAARKATDAAAHLVRTARERRDQAEARYNEGVGTFLELTDAEIGYTNARYEQVRAVFDVGRAHSKLQRALNQH
jgi:outer membrane protein TolC